MIFIVIYISIRFFKPKDKEKRKKNKSSYVYLKRFLVDGVVRNAMANNEDEHCRSGDDRSFNE